MRLIAFLPAVVIALVMALLTGMWQFALFAVLSAISGLITSVVLKQKRKEPDVDFSDQPVWIHPAAVAIGDKVLPRTGWFFREHLSDHFFNHFNQITSAREVLEKANILAEHFYRAKLNGLLPFWAGMAENSDLEYDLVSNGPHALIVGSTGSGKSEFLRLISCSLLAGISAKEIRLVLIDFKGGAALKPLAEHPSTLTLITDIDHSDHERFWLYLQGELKVRELELAKQQVASIVDGKNMPRLLVLADELPAILASSPLALQTFEAIAARGRSLGVHLIATSQSLNGIPRSLLTNLPLRFALGITDPGDLISLLPTLRPSEINASRAIAITGGKAVGFDFPLIQALPDVGMPKVDPVASANWSEGLPANLDFNPDYLGLVEEPLSHSKYFVKWSEIAGSNVLVVGAAGSGKTSFCLLAARHFESVLDCPENTELENALAIGANIACAISTSQVLPLSTQRKFEQIIYLRQSNLDQHLAAGLPRTQWNERLLPGRSWFRGRQMQLIMPERNPMENKQAHELEQLVR